MIRDKLSFGRTEDSDCDEQTADSDDEQPEATVEYEPATDEPGSIPDIHQTLVAPSNIEHEPAAVRTGDRWAKTLWAGEYPDASGESEVRQNRPKLPQEDAPLQPRHCGGFDAGQTVSVCRIYRVTVNTRPHG